MSEIIQQRDATIQEYVPFGATDKVKLSAHIVRSLIAVPTKSGKLPSERDCLRFIAMCRSQRLNPFAGDAFLLGYDGREGPEFSLITAHVAFLKRAESHPEYDGMESGTILRNTESDQEEQRTGDYVPPGYQVVGGWAKVHFKTRKHPTFRSVALSVFQQPWGRWQKDPAGMIVKVAEADALRSSFPTLLGGLYIEGETNLLDIDARALAAVPARREISYTPAADSIGMVIPQREAEPARRGPGRPPGSRNKTTEAPVAPPAESPSEPIEAPADGDLGPQASPAAEDSPQAVLAALLTGHGHTLDQLRRWGTETGNLPTADSISSFDEIPTERAEWLLANRAGLLRQLKITKGGLS